MHKLRYIWVGPVDCTVATTRNSEHKQQIDQYISTTIGFSEMNRAVTEGIFRSAALHFNTLSDDDCFGSDNMLSEDELWEEAESETEAESDTEAESACRFAFYQWAAVCEDEAALDLPISSS
jgi:hypothetical protein